MRGWHQLHEREQRSPSGHFMVDVNIELVRGTLRPGTGMSYARRRGAQWREIRVGGCGAV